MSDVNQQIETPLQRRRVVFGKHFSSMYSGSMVGSGALVFAVWGYVIANQKPDREVGAQVELNPRLLSAILGETVEDVVRAVEFLCAPDPESRSKEEGGRRLIRLGQFDYRVVNGKKYLAMRDEEARRESNRVAQAKSRARKRGKPLPGEAAYVKALENGASEGELSRIVDGGKE
jgi:hypothetical protein